MTTAKRKKAEKRLRRRATTVQKSIQNLMPGQKKSARKASVRKASVVAGTGVLVAAAAGAAVAARLRRKGSPDGATFHVSRDGDDGWALRAEGADDPIQTFATKASAVRAARKAAADSAPSDLMIHLADGTVQATHSYQVH